MSKEDALLGIKEYVKIETTELPRWGKKDAL
jgi:hypothetical protein